jgi:hypothetical protein
MRALAIALIAVSLMLPAAAGATSDKQLQNVKGSVSYQRGSAATRAVAPDATVVLSDKDTAITGEQSQAAVTLADSSRVTMASDTRVQLAFFNQAETTKAKFLIYEGKTRFKVEHPSGHRANYTFVTPTASIAVRGTEGDIGVDGKNLTVNVYGLSDPNLPVVVTTNDGKQFVLKAGQQLLAKWIDGKIQTTVDALTQQALAQFDELGAPVSNWAAAVASLPVVGSVAGNVPGAGNLLGSLFGHRNNTSSANGASPSPSPCASSAPPSGGGIGGFLRRVTNTATPAPCSPSPSPSPTP